MPETHIDHTPPGGTRDAVAGSAWVGGALILLLTCAAYFPAMSAGFVWDDDDHLLYHKVVHDATPWRIWFDRFSSFEYYPVTWSSYWVENYLWGVENPAGFHIVNVLVHVGSAWLLWRVLRRLAVPAALLVAIVFALHPVNVESVAWITQRKNVLSMFFMVAAVLAHLRFEDDRRVAWYYAALASFALAMLSKAGIIGLPIVLLLLAWWRRGTIVRGDMWRVLPYVAIAVAMTIVQQPVRNANVIGDEVVRDDGLFARLAGGGWAVWFYLYKAMLPINLSFVYPRWQINPTNPVVYLPGAALFGLAVLCWRMRRSWGRPCVLALAYYLVMVGPALGFADFYYLRYSFVADHYQYYAIVGVVGLIVPSAMAVLGPYRVALPAAIAVILGCGFMTFVQARSYESEDSLWQDTLRKNPGAWLAHHNLGTLYRTQGRVHDAIGHLERAVNLNPDLAVAHYNLGCALDTVHRRDEAIEHLRRAIDLDADFADAHCSLGSALRKAGRPEEAIKYFYAALDIQDDLIAAHVNLANALAAQNRLDEAVVRLELAIELDPDVADVYYNLGVVLAQLGRINDAMRRIDQALRIDPMHAEAHNAMGNILLIQGRSSAAIHHFREAVQAKPGMVDGHHNLGRALAMIGQVDQAADRFRTALVLNPNAAVVHRDLALALQVTGQAEDAATHYRKAMQIEPDLPGPWRRLAWLLATHPDQTLRDADEAVRVAEHATQLTGRRDVDALDALAAAYASAGQFDRAAETAQQALTLLGPSRRPKAEAIRKRLELYRNHTVYREAPSAGALMGNRPTGL